LIIEFVADDPERKGGGCNTVPRRAHGKMGSAALQHASEAAEIPRF
jgi:hypothetical protein